MGDPDHDLPADGRARLRARRPAGHRGRQGRDVLRLGQLGPRGVRRARARSTCRAPQPARRPSAAAASTTASATSSRAASWPRPSGSCCTGCPTSRCAASRSTARATSSRRQPAAGALHPRAQGGLVRIVLDTGRCSSLGMCEEVAPDLFEVGEDGALVLLDPEPAAARRDAAGRRSRPARRARSRWWSERGRDLGPGRGWPTWSAPPPFGSPADDPQERVRCAVCSDDAVRDEAATRSGARPDPAPSPAPSVVERLLMSRTAPEAGNPVTRWFGDRNVGTKVLVAVSAVAVVAVRRRRRRHHPPRLRSRTARTSWPTATCRPSSPRRPARRALAGPARRGQPRGQQRRRLDAEVRVPR